MIDSECVANSCIINFAVPKCSPKGSLKSKKRLVPSVFIQPLSILCFVIGFLKSSHCCLNSAWAMKSDNSNIARCRIDRMHSTGCKPDGLSNEKSTNTVELGKWDISLFDANIV